MGQTLDTHIPVCRSTKDVFCMWSCFDFFPSYWRKIKVRKYGRQKRGSCFTTLLQIELNSDDARLRSTSQTCLATNQVVADCETLLQTVESSSTFCYKIRACYGFNRTNLSRVWRDSRVILSNQKTVFTELVITWFVARQVWTWLVKHVTFQTVFG